MGKMLARVGWSYWTILGDDTAEKPRAAVLTFLFFAKLFGMWALCARELSFVVFFIFLGSVVVVVSKARKPIEVDATPWVLMSSTLVLTWLMSMLVFTIFTTFPDPAAVPTVSTPIQHGAREPRGPVLREGMKFIVPAGQWTECYIIPDGHGFRWYSPQIVQQQHDGAACIKFKTSDPLAVVEIIKVEPIR